MLIVSLLVDGKLPPTQYDVPESWMCVAFAMDGLPCRASGEDGMVLPCVGV